MLALWSKASAKMHNLILDIDSRNGIAFKKDSTGVFGNSAGCPGPTSSYQPYQPLLSSISLLPWNFHGYPAQTAFYLSLKIPFRNAKGARSAKNEQHAITCCWRPSSTSCLLCTLQISKVAVQPYGTLHQLFVSGCYLSI